MTNPYESPATPSGPGEPTQTPPATGGVAEGFVRGLMACASITFVGAAVIGLATPSVVHDEWEGFLALAVFLLSPVVIGPVTAGVLWATTRRKRRSFATGAVTFAVAAVLIGCSWFALFYFGARRM